MIVIFVSECSKKAWMRSKRILDCYAVRIAGRTWITGITSEGLETVRALLSSDASKNTSVVCHIVSRNSSRLAWIVGSKEKFNHAGACATGYTTKDV